jgi:hypothetical protein
VISIYADEKNVLVTRDHDIMVHVISCPFVAFSTRSQLHHIFGLILNLNFQHLNAKSWLKHHRSYRPYFAIMARKSTRLSSGSTPRKRVIESSESDFDDGNTSGSDFETTKKAKNKRVKVDSPSSEEEEEEEEEDSDDESRPPKVTIIPLPKAREAGDIPFEDGRIHENTMLFLKDLKANNNREWMRCVCPSSPSIRMSMF